ncbi:hypothetical protein V8B97DRAFT_1982161 [Scleroderma yunnanense]
MAGIDTAGIGEVLQTVLARFPQNEKARLVKMELGVVQCVQDPLRGTWRGMAAFANTGGFKDVGVTRVEYEEWGGERIEKW